MNLKKHLPWLGALLPIANTQAETKPNVVIIYIDDMGIGDIGCYGGKFVSTPNIDKLAQDGLLFNQYYSSAPVSSPSRCGLTTGLFPLEVGINTIKNYGFDEYISTYESPDPEPAITATKWIWSDKDSVKRWRRTEYFVDKSIEFVKKHKDEPFFLNLWPDDMHTPWVPEFKQKERKSWETQEAFAPVLAEMDKQLGRFIKTLDELGVGENTIIIFTSDNGPAPSFKSVRSAYLRGTKNSLYEGGIRMPFLIKYPKKIKAGQVNNESVLCAVDLYPSLCAIAGIETEKGYQGDGQNYDKVLLGKSKAKRKTDLMWDFGRNQFFKKPGNANDRSPHLAIRSGNWKLLINSDGSDAQLYDIEKDKFEKNDVAQSHPEVVAKLSKKVCKWFEENKDKGKE